MGKIEKLEEFYKIKGQEIPGNLGQQIGHFNVFRLDSFVGANAQPIPYKVRDYYKITLMIGNGIVHYADKSIEVLEQAIVFSNPQIPYTWEKIDTIRSGFFCIFDQAFFYQYGNLNQYPVFQPGNSPVFDLTNEQVSMIAALYNRMLEEINSDYVYKYDMLRTLVYELLHFAMKLQPYAKCDKQHQNGSQRISDLFLELLERQFPIDENHQRLALRSASDFACQLAVHVNHLNKAVKEATQKTTSRIIAERILQEAKVMLKHSASTVSEISYVLGFTEVTHFNNFFKKHAGLSPLKFRNI